MLKSSELKHPEIYFVVSEVGQEIGSALQDTLKKYRLKYLNVRTLLEENAKKNIVVESEDLGRDVVIAKLIQQKIHKLGNRKYLVEGFPVSIPQLDAFKSEVVKGAQIKGVIHLTSAEHNPEIPESEASKNIKTLLEHAKETGILRNLNIESDKTKIVATFLEFLQKEGIEVPPLIPVICILGGPGSGKGTNSSNLVRDYGFRHISTGDLLRGYKQGQWYNTIQQLMTDGKLVPSSILLQIVKQEIDRYNYEGVYLLDGFPRNQENMDVWQEVMHGFAAIEFFLYLECDEKTMEKRLLGRGADSGRCDDAPEIIKKRFQTFQNMTVPFIRNILKVEEDKVLTVDSTLSPETVYQNIQSEFAKIGITPIEKSHQKPSIIFILGGPGSGKGTQCQILSKVYGFRHLSTGDLLRDQIKQQGPESASIQSYIAEGKLVPSTTLVKLMRNKMHNEGWTGHYLVDGFPRSVENIKAWYEIMKEDVHVDALLYFDCSVETMEKRLLKRGESSGRSDDNPVTIKKRFATFKSETEPFLEFYKKSGGVIHRINTDQTLETVSDQIQDKLKQEKLVTV